jgi:hypothetical protein
MSDNTSTGLNGMNLVMGMVMADREGLDKTEGFKASLLTSFGSGGSGYLQNFLPMYLLLQAKGGETRANADTAAKDAEIARLRTALSNAEAAKATAETEKNAAIAAKAAAEAAKATAERERDDFKTRLDRCKERHPDCDCMGSSVPDTVQKGVSAETNASAGDTKVPKPGKTT